MTVGEMLEVLNEVPEGMLLSEWLDMPFLIDVGDKLIEVEMHQLDIDSVGDSNEDDADYDAADDEMAFIICPFALPPLDDEEEGFFTFPSINLN